MRMAKVDFRTFLSNRIKEGKPVFSDGGMGTMIQASGVTDYKIPEELNFTHPDVIKNIHLQYLKAGSDFITTNTFGATPIKMHGAQFSAGDAIRKAVSLVRDAIDEYQRECSASASVGGAGSSSESASGACADGQCRAVSPKFVALDIGPSGKLIEPAGTMTFDEAYTSYAQAAIAGEKAGADLAIIETMSDLYEVKAAVLAVKENTSLPIIASITFQDNLRTLSGADVLTAVTYMEALGVDAVGMNCGVSLEVAEKLASLFAAEASIPVIMQPNAGLPQLENGKTVFKVLPPEFAASQLTNYKAGVSILGGCCGTTPAHIAAMVQAIADCARSSECESARERAPSDASDKDADGCNCNALVESNAPTKPAANVAPAAQNASSTCVCSGSTTVRIGGSAGAVIVGERINPTGKKKCKEALLSGDSQFILDEAEKQIAAGAHVLDVNVGLPGIDEKQVMSDTVFLLQKTFTCPLQIDSSEPDVLAAAMRRYNGKPLVNSVNGKQHVMDAVFPLVQKYGGGIVALCIDENGIPPTAEGRLAIAEKIVSEAAKYGIKRKDIFIDMLTLTVSSQQKEAAETIRGIRLLKTSPSTKGVKTILGVSNISFGLPRRDIINSHFFSMALSAGLDACIINPLSQSMLDSYRTYRAVYAFDENCMEYIDAYAGTVAPSASTQTAQNPNAGASATGNAPQNPTNPAQTGTGANATMPQTQQSTQSSALFQAIVKGYPEKAEAEAAKLLETLSPMDIVNNYIVPALDNVGDDYASGKKFLPQLLLSADTVSKVFALLKKHIAESSANNPDSQKSNGRVLMATVQGDIHDIGKNIVSAMLENYGFEVIDLGKDVAPETIIKTALEKDIKLIGLSALMTTTVLSMENTIRMLRETEKQQAELGKDIKFVIIAGGAVLTPEYATKIGADYYGKDAMTTVAIAKKVLLNE
jgi:5-methyltetrahydrofolate--homocysteine methyltransferase